MKVMRIRNSAKKDTEKLPTDVHFPAASKWISQTDFLAFKAMRIAPFLRFLLKPETVVDGNKKGNNPIYDIYR